MRKPTALILSSLTFLLPYTTVLADATDDSAQNDQQSEVQAPSQDESQAETAPPHAPKAPFQAFTGKVSKNKVRLRAQSSSDSPMVRELVKGDVFIVLDETDDFYAIQPPAGTKAFVFRTFVLDNVIEGNRVNVRLQPDADAPIIAQLNSGDRVEGSISTLNNKWLEITPPSTARFYIAKDYVEKIGDASLMAKIERRREEVNLLLNSTSLAAQKEMEKDFPNINLDSAYVNYNKVITNYADFPDQVMRARESIAKLQDDYLKKKLPYLEAKAKNSSQITEQMKTQEEKLAQLEMQLQKERANNRSYSPSQTINNPPKANNPAFTDKMSTWAPVERGIYENWAAQNNNGSQNDFYQEQSRQAISLRGIVEPYTRVVKNKPGDYVLINQTNHLPVAFIYSTQFNLQDRVGQEITIHAVPRSNNNFAYPAYFVIGIE